MGMRINRPVSQGNVGRSTGRMAAKKKEQPEAGGGASDSVELSAKENAASIAATASNNVSEVNEAKVAEIKAQIANGEYEADLKTVAEKIISEAVMLSGKK